jgi:hypothetical protein
MWQGITLMVVSMGLVAAGLNLKPDGKVKSKALAAPKERGGELLPEVAQKFAELEAARKAAAQPRPSMLVDPRTFTDEQQVIDTVKALDGKVINNLRNEKTLDVTGRIRSGAVLAADDITNAKKYLVRRYAAQKGWQTRRQREAARKAALAVEQAAATFPQTIEQRQFVDSFAELTAGARQKLAEAPEASRPLWQGRLTALEQLRGFVLERYQSVPRQMILDDINLQDSPEEFLTRLMQKLVIPHYTYENNASVMDKPAIMDAKVENNNLILTSNGAVSVQPIVMPLSEDKETAALLEQFNKYSQTKGREDYFLYPALREGESLLPLEVRKNELHLEVLSMVPSQVLALPADKAMTPVGGIDMNDNLLNVKSAGAGPRIRLKFEVDADRAASFDGFIPKVLSIQPLDLQDFFKLSKASQV